MNAQRPWNDRWLRIVGQLFFIGMMSVGYYYNVTFVQLGLKDLGEHRLGLSAARVAGSMAVLALLTTIVALAFAAWMTRRGWGADFRVKLRISFVVIVVQTVLTAASLLVGSEAAFLAWIVVASAALGVGVPTTFSMTLDLVPVANRGWVAGVIAGAAYLAANVVPGDWSLAAFATQMLIVMPPGVLALGVVAFGRFAWVDRLARQHRDPAFGVGRFVRLGRDGRPRRDGVFFVVVVLMFGIFFVDSLGFLRMIDAPELARPAPTLWDRLSTLTVQGILLAAFAWLVATVAPGAVRRTSEAVAGHAAVAGAMGVLAALVATVLLVIMAFTVVLIPVALVAGIVLLVAVALGWIALGRGLAVRFARSRGRSEVGPMAVAAWTLVVMAGLAVVDTIPVVGPVAALLVTVAGFGAVLITGFGTRRFLPDLDVRADGVRDDGDRADGVRGGGEVSPRRDG